MSTPGHLTDAELADVGGGFRLRINPATRWLAAKAELTTAFGFAPALTGIPGYPHSGGYRTQAEQQGINPAVGYLYSEHCDGRAVDIENQRRFRNVNEARFVSILEKHGITFHVTKEPWHATIATTEPAGGIAAPISSTSTQGEAMAIILIPNNDDSKWYAQSPLTGLHSVVADADVPIMLRYMQWVHGTADDKTNRWNAAAFVTVRKYILEVNPKP